MRSANPVWADPRVERGMARQLELRAARLADGGRHLGWKLGLGSQQALETFAIEAPLVGFLTDASRVESGTTISLQDMTKPAVEPEIAIQMRADLSASPSSEEAAGAIGALGAAIEIADVDVLLDDLEEVVAGDIFHRAVILGAPDVGRAGGQADGLLGRVVRDGIAQEFVDDPESVIGRLVDLACHVAGFLSACGERLRAGNVIIAGSLTPPVWVEPGQRVLFQLEPLEALEVSFA